MFEFFKNHQALSLVLFMVAYLAFMVTILIVIAKASDDDDEFQKSGKSG